MTTTRLALLLAAALTLPTLTVTTASAQSAMPEVRVSMNQTVISSQLRSAMQLEQRAIAKLNDPRAYETIEDITPLMYRAYVLIRAAREGMLLVKEGKKFVDPLLEYEITQTTRAWDLARGPVDWTYNNMERGQYIAASNQNLAGVVAILEAVLEVMP